MKFKDDFQNTFVFTVSFFQSLLKRWVTINLQLYESALLHIFIIFISTLLWPFKQNALRSWWQWPLEKTLDLHVFRKTKSCRQHVFFAPCQIDVVNKQLFCPLSWNIPLPKTALGERYMLMIEEKHSLGIDSICNLICLFFYLLLGCPMANFGSLFRGKQLFKVHSCQY